MTGRSIVGASLALALAVAAAASAAPPRAGTYKGTLDYHKTPLTYNGFNDPVTFSVGPGGKTVTGFSFGFFSCSGVGGPVAAGKNYWLGALKKLPVTALSTSGSFSGSGTWTRSQTAPRLTDTIKYTIRGGFNKAGTTATGTISVNENLTGPSIKTPPNRSSCAVYTFTATHG